MTDTVNTIATKTTEINWENVIIQALNWPFLFFVLLVIVFFLYREKFSSLLERGDIQISWGENRHISLKNLSSSLDEELDPIRDELSALKEKIISNSDSTQKSNKKPPEFDREKAINKMKEALQSHKFRWRSIERLASLAEISEEQAHDLLLGQNDVVISKGKSGRVIARLEHR